MAEKKFEHIPTLEDVVEPGSANEEENIRIIADDSLDDAYDEEFSKLFDTASDDDVPQVDALDIDTTELDTPEMDTPELASPDIDAHATDTETSAEETVQLNSEVSTDQSIDPTDADEIKLTSTGADATPPLQEDESLWIDDWQEEAVQAAVISEDIVEAAGITDIENEMLIEQALEENDQQTSESAPVKPDQTESAHRAASHESSQVEKILNAGEDAVAEEPETETAAIDSSGVSTLDTNALVNELVSELMPEIEWKLRSKIREVLEQHFPPKE